ncbi:MAG: oxygenase MpaB family protein [Luteimonas sp.]
MSAVSSAAAHVAAARIRRWVLGAFPRGQSGIDYDSPPGDPGLFGPDSVTWRIHADFPGMLSGGLCALMLQTLHPRALAGVWDHSNFRDDLVGRLRRTTAFVAGTTYAGRAEAERLIARVVAIHGKVRGTTADGQRYSADDPGLLTWVHVTEAHGFLQGYRRYSPNALPDGAADRYYDEVRRVAEALGARAVPASEAQVRAYLEEMRGELRCDARSREVQSVLSRIRLPVPMAGPSRELFIGAARGLLPEWAPDMLGLTPGQRLRARAAARSLRAMSPLFRSALADGTAQRGCRRAGVPEDVLYRWRS